LSTNNLISIIVCSVNSDLFRQFQKNVDDTIGCEFEIIRIDNTKAGKGICEIYNEGFSRANGNVICYCHEDILFETNIWGLRLNELLSMQEIGLVGCAGAIYKSKYPNAWVAVPREYYRANMIQKKGDGTSFYTHVLDNGNYSEVAVLDGCFLAGRNEVFEKYKWNENFLKGFHLYDLDMSLQVKACYKLVVANEIKITHLSEGNFGLDWLRESERFHRKNKERLPVSVKSLSTKEQKELDYFGMNAYLHQLKQLKEPFLKIWLNLFRTLSIRPFKKQNLSIIKTFAE